MHFYASYARPALGAGLLTLPQSRPPTPFGACSRQDDPFPITLNKRRTLAPPPGPHGSARPTLCMRKKVFAAHFKRNPFRPNRLRPFPHRHVMHFYASYARFILHPSSFSPHPSPPARLFCVPTTELRKITCPPPPHPSAFILPRLPNWHVRARKALLCK